MDTALEAELDRIFAARDRSDMQPTIDALLPLLTANAENARVNYEVGGAYDTDGQEAQALGFYEKALRLGLDGELKKRCYLQYGSTLRNLERYEESLEIFRTALGEFPESAALRAFYALSLHAAGLGNSALGETLAVLASFAKSPTLAGSTDLQRYEAALQGNAEYLRSLDT